jgi:hypothetical protein
MGMDSIVAMDSKRTFLIFGMPRSMTAWMSCFLTCGDVFCQHELSGKEATAKDIARSIIEQPFAASGCADPGALFVWRELIECLPNAELVYVRRDAAISQKRLADVAQVDPVVLSPTYSRLRGHVADFLAETSPMVVDFCDLRHGGNLRSLWKFITGGMPLPEAHLRKMLSLHVTQNADLIRDAARGEMHAPCAVC